MSPPQQAPGTAWCGDAAAAGQNPKQVRPGSSGTPLLTSPGWEVLWEPASGTTATWLPREWHPQDQAAPRRGLCPPFLSPVPVTPMGGGGGRHLSHRGLSPTQQQCRSEQRLPDRLRVQPPPPGACESHTIPAPLGPSAP